MSTAAASPSLSLLKSTGAVASSAATRARATLLPITSKSKSISTRPLGFSAVLDSRFTVHVASKVQSFRGKGTRGVVSMAKKSVGDLTSADLKGKKVFVRADLNVVSASGIEDGWMGLDIGPDSIKTFNEALDTTQTVIWNGPMGVFEMEKFAAGTEAIANKLAELSEKGVTTIIGGGDSVAAVEKVGVAGVMSHISTGGGASLELLEGKVLPGVIALDEA
ncbi:hypothetical protein BRARA_E02825 [Brassica rapa]|uniref:phosphoglycerate kinase n=1 Tax=Brassica campestris TaxID=3711 RepID=A0A397ZE30_BRACM|nr:hypothetical protein BRARA_E02825 [Brassica rapa]